MAVPAINVNRSEAATALVVVAVQSLRSARVNVLQAFAALDQMRDAGAIGEYMATKLGGTTAEATKLYEELNSLKGYVESESPDTLGAAVLQICAKLGV